VVWWFDLDDGKERAEVRPPGLDACELPGGSATYYQAINRQQYDCTYRCNNNRPDESPTTESQEIDYHETSYESTRYTKQDGHNNPTGIIAWHNEFR
jgi:hypothetical protein